MAQKAELSNRLLPRPKSSQEEVLGRGMKQWGKLKDTVNSLQKVITVMPAACPEEFKIKFER